MGFFSSRFYAYLLLAVLVLAADSALAQKTDKITLVNGDRLTCEIKELARGLLRVKTDSAGTIYLEWLDIATIQSEKYFSVETASGVLAFGTLGTSKDQASLEVTYAERTVGLKKNAVVIITRVRDSFWKRLEGSIGLGFSVKKANEDVQLNFSADGEYHSQRHVYLVQLSALVSSQNDNPAAERYVGSFAHQAYLKPKWASLAGAQFEHNTELDLDLRALIQGGAVYRFLNTNKTRLDGSGGLALNNEKYLSEGRDNRTSLELFASVGYDFFKFNTPKADVKIRFTVFPSLTEGGRVRTSLDSKVRWEIIADLNLALTIYSSTDNRPAGAELEDADETDNGTDYGFITSIEWTF